MNYTIRNAACLLGSVLIAGAGISAQQVKRSAFGVTNYTRDVSISPTERRLSATVDVTFTPLEDTRSVALELNGSLKIDSIARIDRVLVLTPSASPVPKTPVKAPQPTQPTVTFVQDQTNSSDLGPHVRVDLGADVPKGTNVVLRFKYSGVLDTAAGGPLLNKRLAAFGENLGYLMYAGRWFPFHEYASDRAAADITVTLPAVCLSPFIFCDQARLFPRSSLLPFRSLSVDLGF